MLSIVEEVEEPLQSAVPKKRAQSGASKKEMLEAILEEDEEEMELAQVF